MRGRDYGAKNDGHVSETVHTAMTSIVSGLILVAVGRLAGPMLRLMGTPEDVLAQSELYIRIYFLGMPVLMVYNFGAADFESYLVHAEGPFYFLFASGVVNPP